MIFCFLFLGNGSKIEMGQKNILEKMMRFMKKWFILLLMLVVGSTAMIQSFGNPLYRVDTSPHEKRTAFAMEKQVLIIGDDLNYPPYSYLDENGEPAGFNIELARAIGRVMGYEVVIKLDSWTNVRKALENHEIDALSGMIYSEERTAMFDFTSRHTMAIGDIFTKKGLRIESLEDLRGKTVIVQTDDIIGEYLDSLDLDVTLVGASTVKEALFLLDSEAYDYAGLLKLPALYNAKEHNLKNIVSQDLNLAPKDYCMVVNKGDEETLLILNSGLQIIKATGEYDQIYEKWLGVYDETTFRQKLYKYRLLILVVVMIVLILMVIAAVLKKIVSIRTAELKEANLKLFEEQKMLEELNFSLEEKNEELIAMEEELRDQFNQLLENEKKLIESEMRNRGIVNALPDLVFTFDKNGTFIDFQSPRVEELVMPKESFVGKTLSEVMPSKIAQMGEACIRKAFDTGELQKFEYELMLNDELEHYEVRFVKSEENAVIGISRNVSADKNYRQKIEYLSYRDQLTGLYNRRHFEDELMRLDASENLPLGIIMADVNGLKLVNDSFGHKMGDQLLKRVSNVIMKSCREDEVMCRIGGDEFVILIPKILPKEIEQVILRIKNNAELEKTGSIDLSISFGWELKYNVEEDVHEVFRRAENYMYKNKLFEGPSMRSKTITAIVHTLNEKNRREEQHSQRVSELSKRLAMRLGFPDRIVEEIKTTGLLHDIGKIAINEAILNKVGQLTSEEFHEIKRHPEIGYRILHSANDMIEISEYVLYHHERWDGTGYPKGLSGNDIPIQSRIISIADTYDAMTSDRTYRKKNTKEEAIKELERCKGTQFDPSIVESFVTMLLEDE